MDQPPKIREIDVRNLRRGRLITVIGCIWYVLAFFWLPPLTAAFYWIPESVGVVLLRAEFVMSAALAATGVIIWRRAVGTPRFSTYVLVIVGASVAVLGVFFIYNWIHL